MEFSSEELDFFKNIFTEPVVDCSLNQNKHTLSIQTSIPSNLKTILGNSKLTLLAEISHYQLWFPVTISLSDAGDFIPELGVPEIIDVQGSQRSWRVNTPENVSLFNSCLNQEIEILSLSGTGLTFKANSNDGIIKAFENASLEMRLPDKQRVTLELDPVRSENNVIAAKFKNFEQGRESLRKFLYNSHKTQYSELYEDIIL
ncbi:hypothetical protein [Colwellia sp. RSH04]|uniref:hypothetical protein n=1 Tax=Colwellia sp. RSH04 TaxID=2305464 RepID=UPI000E588C84|nr:hypothetical protein [Colwellia sp. RSH04]RHW75059.1 hypothetical protein D1094_15690 [Colwellia sp. RSH04]